MVQQWRWILGLATLQLGAVGCTVSTGTETPTPSFGTFDPGNTPTPTNAPTPPPSPTATATPTAAPTPTPTATEIPTDTPDPTPQDYFFEATLRGGDARLVGDAHYVLDREPDGSELLSGITRLDYLEIAGVPFAASTQTTATIGPQGRLATATILQTVSVGDEHFDRRFSVDATARTLTLHREGFKVEWPLPGDNDPIVPWSWESDPFLGFAIPDVGMAYIAAKTKESTRQSPLIAVPDFFSTDFNITGNGPCYTLRDPFCISRDIGDTFIETMTLGDIDGTMDRIRLLVETEPVSVPEATVSAPIRTCNLPSTTTIIPDRISRGAQPTLAIEYDLPQGDGPFPTVLFVADQGGDDRDWIKAGTPTARCLALRFLDAGVAVVRYDDRGHGESGGAIADTSFIDRTGDLVDVLNHIISSGNVSPDEIIIVAHGEGAAHVASAIAEGEISIAGLVSIGTYTGTGDDVWIDRSETWLGNIDLPSDYENDVLAAKSEAMTQILSGRYLDETFEGLSIDYWEDYWTRDINLEWAQVGIPVNIIHGGRDWEVDPSHAQALATLLGDAGNGSVTVTTFPALGHRMTTPIGAADLGREYYLPSSWDPGVEVEILAWTLNTLD